MLPSTVNSRPHLVARTGPHSGHDRHLRRHQRPVQSATALTPSEGLNTGHLDIPYCYASASTGPRNGNRSPASFAAARFGPEGTGGGPRLRVGMVDTKLVKPRNLGRARSRAQRRDTALHCGSLALRQGRAGLRPLQIEQAPHGRGARLFLIVLSGYRLRISVADFARQSIGSNGKVGLPPLTPALFGPNFHPSVRS